MGNDVGRDSETAAGRTQVEWAPREWFQAQTSEGTDGASSYFGHAANGYQRFRHQALVEALQAHTRDLSRGVLVDLGCATGELTALIGRSLGFERVIGVDFVPEVLAAGRTRFPDIEFREGALPATDFPDSSVDLVIASEVLYYLTPEARQRAVAEIARILRPNGRLLFTAALGEAYFSPSEARALLAERFGEDSVVTLRMKLYHSLANPFYLARRLDGMLRSGSIPASAEMQARFRRWEPLLRVWPVRVLIRMLSALGGPVLASETLPRTLSRIPVLSGSSTNIIIVARRL